MNDLDSNALKALLRLLINANIEFLALKCVLLLPGRIPETELADALEVTRARFAPFLKQLDEMQPGSLLELLRALEVPPGSVQ